MKRTCAYCNDAKGKGTCRCSYRYGRLGGAAYSQHNTSTETSIAEMKAQFDQFFSHIRDMEARGAWMFSFTQYDEKKLRKNKLKLAAREDKKGAK